MIIRCWGARGSIPVSGEGFLRYGGNTTCLELRSGTGEVLLVDAGSGLRGAGNALMREGRTSVSFLFTHAHWDHILGFPFFKPLYDERADITVYGCPLRQGNMETMLARVMSPPYFPVPYEQVRGRILYGHADLAPHELCGLTVSAIPLSHPNMGLGYRFEENGRSFVFLTDNELGHAHRGAREYAEYVAFCRGADLLFHDAEYTVEEYAARKGWGHSSHVQALRLAVDAGVARFGLFHHNQDRDDDGVDALVADCRGRLVEEGVDMDCFGVRQGQEFEL